MKACSSSAAKVGQGIAASACCVCATRSALGKFHWRRAASQVSRYAQAVVPQSGLALDAARSSYLAGRGDFSTVIDDFDGWLEARTGLARREAERFTTWAELEALVGSGGPADDGRRGR